MLRKPRIRVTPNDQLFTQLLFTQFFFVEKKGGGLHPCIIYCGLNKITVNYPYPLPLLPATLEQLREAKIFNKLDLCSAYNFIIIREGNKWKTTAHYHYLVMPYGLAGAPSISQCFINNVLRVFGNV